MMSSVIPEGKYLAKVSNAHGYLPTAKGGDQYVAELDLGDGRTIEWRGMLEGPGLEFSAKALVAMGMTNGDPETIVPGKAVRITVKHEEYNGKTRAKVKFVDAVGGGKIDPKRAADIRKRILQITDPAAASALASDADDSGFMDAPLADDPFA
jgi:hypothetical protein